MVGRGVLTAPPGDTTTWFYAAASGVMTNKLYADGKGTRYTYTDDGKLATRTWARGIVTTYAYDGWNNLTNTSYSDDTPTVTVAYDALGRQTEAHDAAGVTTIAYDAYGANTNETVIGVAGTNVIERFADQYGRDAGYALNGARQTILGYDERTGRLATMQTPSANESAIGNASSGNSSPDNSSFLIPHSSFTWTYLHGSDLKSKLVYPNGLTASWTYDANNQLLQVCNATPTNVISQYDYTYDAAGRRIACTRSGDAMSVVDTIAYAYNERGELTNALSNVDANYAYAYQYDDIGNRVASSERGTNTTYAANELNQYTSIVGGPAESEPEFDDDGNQTLIRTATGMWRVTYNGENRSVRWTCLDACDAAVSNSETIVMSYDRMGRRVTKNAERFVYNGYLQIANNNCNAYIWDCTEPVATRPLVWNVSTFQPFNFSTFFYVHDGNKNVCEVSGAGNAVAAHYEYVPFGSLVAQRGEFASENPWRFSCEFFDVSIGCHYYSNRHLGLIVGRWLSRDPIEEQGGVNLYCLLGNEVIVMSDALGLSCEKGKDLTYVADSPGYDTTELLGRVTHWGYIDLNDENDFSPNDQLGECECVKSLLIIAHGEKYVPGKNRFQWGSSNLYEGGDDTPYHDVTGLSDKFKNIKFCKKCVIDIRSCWSGVVAGLADRIRANSRIFDNRQRDGFDGCRVVVYDGKPNVLGWLGGKRGVGK